MSQKLYADMTEMVFEDRDRAYGAYRLRKLYNQRLVLATFVGLGLFFAGITAPNLVKEDETIVTQRTTEVCLECLTDNPFKKEEKIEEVIPDLPPPRKAPRTVALLIPEPTHADDLDQETDPTMPDLETLAKAPVLGLSDIEGEDGPIIDIPIETGTGTGVIDVEEKEEPNAGDFIFVSHEPEPVNMDDVKELIGYPALAIENGIQGEVMVRVLVDKEGRYRRHKVTKKAHPLLAEAVEKQIPKLVFTPALQGNKPVMFWVNVPFRFVSQN